LRALGFAVDRFWLDHILASGIAKRGSRYGFGTAEIIQIAAKVIGERDRLAVALVLRKSELGVDINRSLTVLALAMNEARTIVTRLKGRQIGELEQTIADHGHVSALVKVVDGKEVPRGDSQ